MKVDVESMEGCKRRLAVEAPLDVVQKEWERAYGRVQKQARLPGFRKGHVPRSLVKVHFADDVRREVAEHLDSRRLPPGRSRKRGSIRWTSLDLQDLRLEEGAPLSLRRGRGGQARHRARRVQGPRRRSTRRGPSPAPSRRRARAHARAAGRVPSAWSARRDRGDLVIVDYTLTPEGQEPSTARRATPSSSATTRSCPRSTRPWPACGRERSAQVGSALARRSPAGGAAGQAGHGGGEGDRGEGEGTARRSTTTWPSRSASSRTLAALRAEVRRSSRPSEAAEDRHALEDKVVDALLARHEFAVPESLVMRQIAHQIEHARERMRRQGVDPDAPALGLPEADRRAAAGRRACGPPGAPAGGRGRARGSRAPREADLEAEVERIAQAGRRPAPAVRRMMEKSGDLDALRLGLRERMTSTS